MNTSLECITIDGETWVRGEALHNSFGLKPRYWIGHLNLKLGVDYLKWCDDEYLFTKEAAARVVDVVKIRELKSRPPKPARKLDEYGLPILPLPKQRGARKLIRPWGDIFLD
jgi:hypothetical protein